MHVFYIKSDIADISVKITNNSDLEEEILRRRLLSIPSIRIVPQCEKCSYIVEISDEKIVIIGGLSFEFKGHISQSDGYVFIHALFYRIFYDCGYVCLHAGAVSNVDGEATLFVGEFGSGKSHLNHFFAKNGYEICSADHSLIKIENGRPMFVAGSCFDMFEEEASCLEYSKCNKKMPVAKILVLKGVQDGGQLDIKEVEGSSAIAKILSSYMFWPYFSGVLSMEKKCFSEMFPKNMSGYVRFWENIEKIYLCRGDKIKIFEAIKNERR